MKRCCVYSRISYYDRDSDSLKSQVEQCREYAAQNGYTIVAELQEDDRGASGADFDLPALNRALELARNNKIDILVTREMDRFARGLAKQILTEREFNNAGVSVEYVIGAYDNSPEGVLQKHVRAIIAEYEREKISERMTRGRLRSVRRGNVWVGHIPPFGYRRASIEQNGNTVNTLVPQPDEAEWVRTIFRWYVFGDDGPPMALRKIAKKLTELGVPTVASQGNNTWDSAEVSGIWYHGAIARIIANRTYAGEWIYHSIVGDITVNVEPIIDRALFDKAQKRRRSAKRLSRRNTKHPYLFRGRVICQHCGWRMHGERQTKTYKDRTYHYLYYFCPGSREGFDKTQRCAPCSYPADKADAAVWSKLREYLLDPRMLTSAIEQANTGDGAEHIQSRLDALARRIAEQETMLSRFLDLYGLGSYTMDALLEKQTQINADIERLADERAQLETQLANAVMRRDQAGEIVQIVGRIRLAVERADRDFNARRQIVDSVDASIHLERLDDSKIAHIYLGEYRVAVVRFA